MQEPVLGGNVEGDLSTKASLGRVSMVVIESLVTDV